MGISDVQAGALIGREDNTLQDFNLEISWMGQWVILNDHLRYITHAEGLGVRAVTRRRQTVTSPFYDGEFETHSVKENVKERVQIWVNASSQSELVENIILLEDAFSQSVYNIRKTLDESREVWTCQSADYTVDQSHVYAHNCTALFSADVPRLPAIQHEVVY